MCADCIWVSLVGYIEFIFLPKERPIHVDYFVIESARRTAGAFYTFADQLRSFFDEENLEWDFLTAEVLDLDVVNGVSKKCATPHPGIFRLLPAFLKHLPNMSNHSLEWNTLTRWSWRD